MQKKHLLVSALLLGCAVVANAQLVNVKSIEKVNVTESVDKAEISPDGASVVVSSNLNPSLTQVNLVSGQAKLIAANGSMQGLQFSDDSKHVVYVRRSQNANHLQYKEVRSIDLASGQEAQITKPSRNLNAVAMNGKSALVVDNKKMIATNLAGEKVAKAPVASVYYGQLMITENGKTRALNPNGKEGQSYLWPVVSPDGSKVVYYLANSGCYYCNIDGSNVTFLGNLRAARWMGNDMVVGMRDIDDGEVTTASSIVAMDLKGTEQVLTGSDVIALYPSVSKNADKISFSTENGELYIINVEK